MEMAIEANRARRPRWRRAVAARPVLLAVAAAVTLLALVDWHWKADPDTVCYLSLARSFASGRGMLRLGMRQWYYAPLYAIWISPAFRWGASPFLGVSVINVVTTWGLVLGTYCWFRPYSRRGAGYVAALVGVNVGLWDVCREARAETLFSSLVIWAAVFLSRAARDGPARRFAADVTLGAALVVAACLTRQVGLFLTPGFAAVMAKRWAGGRASAARLVAAGGVGLLAAGAVGWLVVHEHQSRILDGADHVATYVEQYREPNVRLASQIVDGVRRQTADVGRLMLPGMWGSFARRGHWLNVNTVLYVAFTIPVLGGWWRLARRTGDPLLWSAPIYAAIFVVWPFDQGTRFNVPMLPVLWASGWAMLQVWPRRRTVVLGAALAMHWVAGVAYLVHDRAVVARASGSLPMLSALVQRIDGPGEVAWIGPTSAERLNLIYLLDRAVLDPVGVDRRVSQGTRWVVSGPTTTGRPAAVPTGFDIVAKSGRFTLCRAD